MVHVSNCAVEIFYGRTRVINFESSHLMTTWPLWPDHEVMSRFTQQVTTLFTFLIDLDLGNAWGSWGQRLRLSHIHVGFPSIFPHYPGAPWEACSHAIHSTLYSPLNSTVCFACDYLSAVLWGTERVCSRNIYTADKQVHFTPCLLPSTD